MKSTSSMGSWTLNSHKLSWTEILYPLSGIYIFILIASCSKFVASQPSATSCILDFNLPSPPHASGCEGGDWGGFLHNNCCDVGFQKYLYGLGKRANQTGQIYLNSTEQKNCLTSMKSFQGDVFSCGIEKLTSGAGGCSDFSVADVSTKLVGAMNENCQLVSSNGGSNTSCDSCVGSWKNIRSTTHSASGSSKVQNDICRFAVLVSLTSSRIEDEEYAKALYKCLGEQKIDTEEETREPAGRKISTGTWILIGCLTGLAGMIIIAAFILRRKSSGSKKPPKIHALNNVLVKKRRCPKVSIREVYAATNNLNELNVIGEGTAGKVYKGVLSNNQHVAIKHIMNDGDAETFAREVTNLAHIKHPNLVALLGCCVRQDECFLVYELCPNGNLSEWLFGKDKVLSWKQRLEIAIDSARGLWFLHTYPEGCIVHRDVKPTNILLAANFEAKLSDFGLSKVIDLGETYASSEVRGTFGYVDPEYQSNHQVKASGDVYSFGIVLLQILSGKKVINLNVRTPIRLNKMAKDLTRDGSTAGFADPKLDGDYPAEAFELTLQLALSCTALKRERPSMEQVVQRLEALNMSTSTKASTPES